MVIKTNIHGTNGKSVGVKVSNQGELITRALDFSESAFNQITTAAAFNYALPKSGSIFLITGFIANADKSVTSSSVVDIYEAISADSTDIVRSILKFDLNKLQIFGVSQLGLIVRQGFFLNAKADDQNVNLTIMGYYINTA